MEYMEFKGKTKSDAITEACRHFSIPSDRLDYEVVDEGKAGFLGMGARPAVVKARVKEQREEVIEPVVTAETPVTASAAVEAERTVDIDVEAVSKKFMADVFAAMGIAVEISATYNDPQ